MLGFFPTPYPDELLYSVFARYHIRSGNIKPSQTLQELFNSQNVIVRADLPYKLNSLIENLSILSTYTVETLIQKHTLYPMYAVFLPDSRSAILDYMKGELGTYVYRGIPSSVHIPKYFRFCPVCLEEELSAFGEAYWHRLHQTPGVIICPIHHVALSNSTVPFWTSKWSERGVASLLTCPTSNSIPNYNDFTLSKLRLITSDIESLMTRELNLLPCKDFDWFHIQYIALLIKQGLATLDRHVSERALRQKFESFYGSELFEALGIDISYYNRDLFDILRLRLRVFDPVMHLLMIRFLTNSITKFFAGKLKYKPFGNGLWLCLNPACVNYLQPVVTKLVMSSKKNNIYIDRDYSYIENPRGTFECNCGFKYTKVGADTTEVDKFRYERIVAFGSLWEKKYLQLNVTDRQDFQSTVYDLSCNYGRSPINMLRKLEALWKSLNHTLQKN